MCVCARARVAALGERVAGRGVTVSGPIRASERASEQASARERKKERREEGGGGYAEATVTMSAIGRNRLL